MENEKYMGIKTILRTKYLPAIFAAVAAGGITFITVPFQLDKAHSLWKEQYKIEQQTHILSEKQELFRKLKLISSEIKYVQHFIHEQSFPFPFFIFRIMIEAKIISKKNKPEETAEVFKKYMDDIASVVGVRADKNSDLYKELYMKRIVLEGELRSNLSLSKVVFSKSLEERIVKFENHLNKKSDTHYTDVMDIYADIVKDLYDMDLNFNRTTFSKTIKDFVSIVRKHKKQYSKERTDREFMPLIKDILVGMRQEIESAQNAENLKT